MGYYLTEPMTGSPAESAFALPCAWRKKKGLGAPFLQAILSTKYGDSDLGLYYYGYRYLSPGMGRWLSRDPIGEYAFFTRFTDGLRGLPRQDRLDFMQMLHTQTLEPTFVMLDNNLVNEIDPFGLLPWSSYTESINANGSSTITIKKNCVIVVLFGHGLASKPHSFVFEKHCQAGGFVGCDAGATNNGIPAGKRIDDLKMTNGDLYQPGTNYPDEERFPHWFKKAKKGAKTKAEAICNSSCACCEKVDIYGELAGSAMNIDNWPFPGGWSETVDCAVR